jgi:hypothetical protein
VLFKGMYTVKEILYLGIGMEIIKKSECDLLFDNTLEIFEQEPPKESTQRVVRLLQRYRDKGDYTVFPKNNSSFFYLNFD